MNLKNVRKASGLTQQEVASAIGLTRTAYGHYENGLRDPDSKTLIKLAELLGTSVDYLLTGEKRPEALPLPSTKKVQRLGVISCGNPIFCDENFSGYDDVPESIRCDFTLRCQGDSMTGARLYDGDIVYIRKQNYFENGDIVAVLIDNDVTLKRAIRNGEYVVLQPENPKYEPIVLDSKSNASILGVAVGFVSKL